ncbi:hypothetical protein [Duganella sp.]|uniref:hypothetical protein n=1 Tax=Duganella sp. TaxID=1904440 RepID=UPI0031D9C149
MRRLRLLLLLIFVLSSSAQAMASVHKCCPSAACGMAQCVDLGCAPVVPAMAFNRPAAARLMPAAQAYTMYLAMPDTDPYEEVWTPPD